MRMFSVIQLTIQRVLTDNKQSVFFLRQYNPLNCFLTIGNIIIPLIFSKHDRVSDIGIN